MSADELLGEERYDAVFIATGAGLPRFLDVPGEHLSGVYSANEFLTRVNLMQAYRFPDYDEPVYDCRNQAVAVVGGGNTALDAVRTAVRLGAKSATVLYRRSEVEMPARREEVRHAGEEGVEFRFLTCPVEFLGDERGVLKAVRCVEMELGDPDASGRRRPLPVAGSETDLPVDVCGIALGTGAKGPRRNKLNNLRQVRSSKLRSRRYERRW